MGSRSCNGGLISRQINERAKPLKASVHSGAKAHFFFQPTSSLNVPFLSSRQPAGELGSLFPTGVTKQVVRFITRSTFCKAATRVKIDNFPCPKRFRVMSFTRRVNRHCSIPIVQVIFPVRNCHVNSSLSSSSSESGHTGSKQSPW